MLITAMFGSAAAMSVSAPNLLVPMWGLLFGSLGWNFLEFAFKRRRARLGLAGLRRALLADGGARGLLILVGIKNAVLPPTRHARRRFALVGAGVRRARRGRLPVRGVELRRLR